MADNKQVCSPNSKNIGKSELVAIFIIVLGLYVLSRQFNLLPNIGISNSVSYGFAFVLGLAAAVSSCTATTGSLLLIVSQRYSERNPHLHGSQKFKPHIYFNIGRVISYAVLGGLLGVIGSFFILSQTAAGILMILVSLTMILLGLQILHIFPSFITMPRFIAEKIFNASEHSTGRTSFLFGAATFFFPCGFTQALQLYVMTQGSFMTGALTMLFFSLGTLPALVSIGAASSFSKGASHRYLSAFAGVLAIVFGFIALNGGLGLTGYGIHLSGTQNTADADVVGGNQIINMRVDGLSYYPSQFTIKKGVPVEWHIDGRNADGCAGVLNVPKLKILQRLDRSQDTIITFTPEKIGKIDFSCSMWMAGPGVLNVI